MSKKRRVFIIAEAGINHNGDMQLAYQLVDAAAAAGADAVKFQTFKAERLVSRYAPKAEYQKKATGTSESQLEMLRRLELSPQAHRKLFDYCVKKKILFLSTPFDLESVALLKRLGMSMFKIPSGEITNLPYLQAVGRLGKKVILSTGMANLGEIKDALAILTSSGTLKKNITVLHCTTEYPAPMSDVNLLAMLTIRDTFKIAVGYSDHTHGIEVPIASAALGATVIEKHFTLDRSLPGPDHRASLEPEDLKVMVRGIRNIEKALGNGIKAPAASELKNRLLARKSIVAAKEIRKGEVFTVKNITVKRPGNGISPMQWDMVIGRKAKKDFAEDDKIEL